MPPAAAGLIIAAGATFAAGAVTVGVGTAALLAGITFGAGALQALLFSRPSQEGNRSNTSSPTESLNIAYGEVKAGGRVSETAGRDV